MIGYDMNVTPKNQMPKVVKSDENSDQLYIVCLFGITIDADRGGSKNCERLRFFGRKECLQCNGKFWVIPRVWGKPMRGIAWKQNLDIHHEKRAV